MFAAQVGVPAEWLLNIPVSATKFEEGPCRLAGASLVRPSFRYPAFRRREAPNFVDCCLNL